MKLLNVIAALWMLGSAGALAQKISQYPNTNAPASNDLLLLALPNSVPPTNKNISYGQLSNAIRGPLITGASGTNFTVFEGTIRSSTNVGNFQVPAGSTVSGPGFTINPTVLDSTKGAGKYIIDSDGNGTMVWSNIVETAASTVVYVSPWGNNSTAVKGRKDKPWQGLSNAVAAASNGDIIWLLPGIHTNSGNAAWAAAPGTSGGAVVNYYKRDLRFYGENYPTLLFPTGRTCVLVWRCQNITFDGIVFANDKTTNNVLITSNAMATVAANHPAGITILESTNIRVQNCIFTNMFGYGVSHPLVYTLWPMTNGVTIDRCQFYNCGIYTSVDTFGVGGAVLGTGNWHMRDNEIRHCVNGLVINSIFATTLRTNTPPWSAINNRLEDVCTYGIGNLTYNQAGAIIRGNQLRRPTNHLEDPFWPADNWLIASPIRISGGPSVTVQDNMIDGGRRGIYIVNESSQAVTNLVVQGNFLTHLNFAGLAIEADTEGSLIAGNTFYENYRYHMLFGLGGNPDYQINMRVLNNLMFGQHQFPIGQDAAFSYKFSDLVSNFWFDGNIARLEGPPTSEFCFRFDSEGPQTNVYIGANMCIGETNLLSFDDSGGGVAGTPLWTSQTFLIETNPVDPLSIDAACSWSTNLSARTLSITAIDDAVSTGAPASWYSASGCTNLIVMAWPTNGYVVLSVINTGPSACNPPGAMVKTVVNKPPPLWPGRR